MRNLITTMAMLALIGSPAAMAQTGSNTGSPRRGKSGPGPRSPGRPPSAARGRRSLEKNLNDPNDPLSKENALLDKKIKSICRGC